MKSIFEFIDYRRYLAHFYDQKKASTRHFSYRWFAQKAGINSSSFLKHIIDGSRNLTPRAADKFCPALGFNAKESTYFRHLVLFNQAKTANEKQEHYAVLRSLAGNVSEKYLKSDQYEYYENWYTSVIRELVCLHAFKDDFAALARSVCPPITLHEANRAVKLLLKLKLIAKRADGGYDQTVKCITADDEVVSLALRDFTARMIRLSEEALGRYPSGERHISGITLGASPETFHVLIAELEAFKDRIKAIINRGDKGSRVYQFNLSLFPMSVETRDSGGSVGADV